MNEGKKKRKEKEKERIKEGNKKKKKTRETWGVSRTQHAAFSSRRAAC
jgi:hypothetical protein